jgi:hypothetical protein
VLGCEFLYRQQLHRIDAKRTQIWKPRRDIEKPPAAPGADVRSGGVYRLPGADVELIDDQIPKLGRPPACIVPRIG